jgi:hypothetical protein
LVQGDLQGKMVNHHGEDQQPMIQRSAISGANHAIEANHAIDDFDARPPTRWLSRLLKIGLPLLGLGVAFAMFWKPGDSSTSPTFDVAAMIALQNSRKLSNPHFVSTTQKGEPISLRAVEARPESLDFNRVELTTVSGEMEMLDGRLVTLTAAEGLYNRETNRVEGIGDVVISTSDGYAFQSQSLIIEIDKSLALSDVPVHGLGSQGVIDAGAMRIYFAKDDMRAVFFKGVKVTIQDMAKSRVTGE